MLTQAEMDAEARIAKRSAEEAWVRWVEEMMGRMEEQQARDLEVWRGEVQPDRVEQEYACVDRLEEWNDARIAWAVAKHTWINCGNTDEQLDVWDAAETRLELATLELSKYEWSGYQGNADSNSLECRYQELMEMINSIVSEGLRDGLWAYHLGCQIGDEDDSLQEMAAEVWGVIKESDEDDFPECWRLMRAYDNVGLRAEDQDDYA